MYNFNIDQIENVSLQLASISTPAFAELEFRWVDGIYSDEKILQVKNLKQPTHADGNFEDRVMSLWSTVYAREDNEDQFGYNNNE